MSNQYSIFDDCFVDSFAGGGGASTGIELATGHPVDVNGQPITRADQVARCGNAVCPAVAEALVRANLPEHCKKKISDMAHLHNVMTS